MKLPQAHPLAVIGIKKFLYKEALMGLPTALSPLVAALKAGRADTPIPASAHGTRLPSPALSSHTYAGCCATGGTRKEQHLAAAVPDVGSVRPAATLASGPATSCRADVPLVGSGCEKRLAVSWHGVNRNYS